MAKVKAVYNYSYNYEGKKISFKKDEQFQLLTKSNKDWWHVRRWLDEAAQDIYVPAVYVVEVEKLAPCTEELYVNLDDVKMPGVQESNGSFEEEDQNGGMTSLLQAFNKPATKNIHRKVAPQAPVAKKEVQSGYGGNTNPQNTFTFVQSNGVKPLNPVSSPSLSHRFNHGGGVAGNNPPAPLDTGVLGRNPKKEGPMPGTSYSLSRGEKLNPPTTSTKPRSKSNNNSDAFDAAMLNRSFDAGTHQLSSFGAHAPLAPAAQAKLPPPVHVKPKPVKNTLQQQRPASVFNAEHDGVAGDGSNKQVASELSNILMKKKPYLGEHRMLSASLSTSAVESSSFHASDRHTNLVSGRFLEPVRDFSFWDVFPLIIRM